MPLRAQGAEPTAAASRPRQEASGSRLQATIPPVSPYRFPTDSDTTKKHDTALSDLSMDLKSRIEGKGEKTKNERCNTSQYFNPLASCRGSLQPNFDLQFAIKSAGTVADRVHVDVDYDTQREFDASNALSVWYEGKPGEKVQRLELGNVSFLPPASRFLTSGVPSGNYGAQAVMQFGRVRLRTLAATQKGNVVQSKVFQVGDRTLSGATRDIEDYQVEQHRFFWTVDPTLLRGFPQIDILDRTQLDNASSALADTLRPTKVWVYRLQYGAQPTNPNGPRFRLLGDPSNGRQVYDLQREGIDYVVDPSQLWIALVRPLNPANERLVVAYNVKLNGRDTIYTNTGGTPALQATTEDQFANLIWDPSVQPGSKQFEREIRAAYRVAGEDLQRQSLQVHVVAGSGDQEKPIAGSFETYLQMLGISQSNNSGVFDVETRLWPRPSDQNFNLSQAGSGARILHDYFLILPTLRPFAQVGNGGLIAQGNPANPTIYTTPGEYLTSSSQRPASVYRFRVKYDAEGGGAAGSLTLGAVQLRKGSERLSIDGYQLVRDVDYRIDYDLGQVSFMRPDTLFPRTRNVEVRYEENPLFEASPTSIFGANATMPFTHGRLDFTAISQSQRTTFTRPQLGFEPVSSLVGGVTGQFGWEMPALGRALRFMSFGARRDSLMIPRLSIFGEMAASRPQSNSAGQAYLESFEGDGGITVPLSDPQWYFSSLPAYGTKLSQMVGSILEADRASTMAWQNNGVGFDGKAVVFRINDIDPQTNLAGTGLASPEQLLWLTLYPLNIGGRFNTATRGYDWTVPGAPSGRRFRSIRTVLSPAGIDVSRSEYLEFWTLVDTSIVSRRKNPTLVFDFGDVSENSLTFGPTQLVPKSGGDTTFTGKAVQGFNVLDSERDQFTRAFDVGVNDVGLPGDVVSTIAVSGGATLTNFPTCAGFARSLLTMGDSRVNCTVHNNRLDEEDIDQDNVLNLTSSQREQEKLMRYVIDLSDPARYTRIGRSATATRIVNGVPVSTTKHWVLVRVPFRAPFDSIGQPLLRRIKALRLTVISGTAQGDDEFTELPIGRLRLSGAPWIKRTDRPITGIAGVNTSGNGYVITSLIGTADRDSLAGLDYQSPPGVGDELDTKTGQFAAGVVQINEKSLRLLAGGLAQYQRAEAYYKFPSGDQNFMGYQELRLWARGRRNGWGDNGELQMYVKAGRDENNFYMYRTPVQSGAGQAAWLPEVRVDFRKFQDLRRRLQNAYLKGSADSLSCTGTDLALIAASGLPLGTPIHRYAACDGGYMVYTIEPAVTPPNLAAVQELSVGMVRIGNGTGTSPTAPGDTLELWIDDIRLAHVVNQAGYAGQVGMSLTGAGLADLRFTYTRRDPHFRQLNEQQTFNDEQSVELASTLHLEKLIPGNIGYSFPLTITHVSSQRDPLFLAQSDIRGAGLDGLRTPRDATTTYSLTMRRTVPMASPLLGMLFNNLSATSTYVAGDDRSEYRTGRQHNFSVAMDYLVADEAKTVGLPNWMNIAARLLPGTAQGIAGDTLRERGTVLRWNPSQFRVTSGVVRGTERRFAFLKPADALDDQPRVTVGLTNLWRNGSELEFRPTGAFTARWNLVSLRDLRDYGDTNQAAIAATRERSDFLGVTGLERERSMETQFTYSPTVSTWWKPRADFGTRYSFVRDPNTRILLTNADSLTFRLPRRFNSGQTVGAGVTFDLARALRARGLDSARMVRVAHTFAPIELRWDRSLLSAFDAAPFTPGVGFQLGLGGTNAFREARGLPASTAGAQNTLSASTTISLPFGTSFINRARRTTNQSWTRRTDLSQARVDGVQTVFPDVMFRWNAHPASHLGGMIQSAGATVGWSRALASSTFPGENSVTAPELRASRVTTLPIAGSIAWGFGGLSTSGGFSLTNRVDSLPGSFNRGRVEESNMDVGRSFRVPKSWGLGIDNDVRARAGFQSTRNTVHVLGLDAANGVARSLVDNGRSALNLTADTDLSDQLQFTFQLSRVITYDNNLNRRLNQFVVSTVLSLNFFAGRL
ncbi:MAG: hypothetical protein JWO05_2181 [Gemmatimonadetes bacterium]|nr:hypothetical protein [Gemmatimonadota bacterium]